MFEIAVWLYCSSFFVIIGHKVFTLSLEFIAFVTLYVFKSGVMF